MSDGGLGRGVFRFRNARRGRGRACINVGCSAHFVFGYRKGGCCSRFGGLHLGSVYRRGPHTGVDNLMCLPSMSGTQRLLVNGIICARVADTQVSSDGDCSNCGAMRVTRGRGIAVAGVKMNDGTCPMGVIFRSAGNGSCCIRVTLSEAGSNVSGTSFRTSGGAGCFPGTFSFGGRGTLALRGLGDGCINVSICPGRAVDAGYGVGMRKGAATLRMHLLHCAPLRVGSVSMRLPGAITVLALRSTGKDVCRARMSLGCSVVAGGRGCVRSVFTFKGVQGRCPCVARRG